jgi:hypothetical protein
MKLTSVEIHPANSTNIAILSFRDPTSANSYNVKGITGLDADEITPRYYGASGSTKFYNLSLGKKDIVFKIGLNPNFATETYSDLRDALYKMIASSRTGRVQVRFKNDTEVIAAVSGFISKFESPLFEKTQEILITVSCDDPMLRAITAISVPTLSLDPSNTVIWDEKSTAPHGFAFELLFTSPVASLLIEDPDDETWSFEVVPSGGFLADDVLFFSSEYNDKYLHLLRGIDIIYLADVITSGSIWPIIFPGENTFTLNNPSVLTWNSVSYYPAYWGV